MSGWDNECVWPYQSSYVEHMPTCVYSPPGLGESAHPPAINLPDYSGAVGPSPLAFEQAKIAQAGFQNLYLHDPQGGTDWTTLLIYGGIGLVIVLALTKGRK